MKKCFLLSFAFLLFYTGVKAQSCDSCLNAVITNKSLSDVINQFILRVSREYLNNGNCIIVEQVKTQNDEAEIRLANRKSKLLDNYLGVCKHSGYYIFFTSGDILDKLINIKYSFTCNKDCLSQIGFDKHADPPVDIVYLYRKGIFIEKPITF